MKKTAKIFFSVFQNTLAAALFMATGAMTAACSDSDDEKNGSKTDTDNVTETEVPAGSTAFCSDLTSDVRADGPRRMSLFDYDFYWTEGDKIFIHDAKTNKYIASDEEIIGSGDKNKSATFIFNGDYTADEYTVFFAAKQHSTFVNSGIAIPSTQKQGTPGDPSHIFTDGDCAHATATRGADGRYRFKLQHDAAYLKIFPYLDERMPKGIKLIKMEIQLADPETKNPITSSTLNNYLIATYTNYKTEKQLKTVKMNSHNKMVTLWCGNATNVNDVEGFEMAKNSTEAFEKSGCYAVISPTLDDKKYCLLIDYWMKGSTEDDYFVIRRVIDEREYKPNSLTQIRHKLGADFYFTMKNTYAQWDAETFFENGGTYNTSTSEATNLCKDMPSYNELTWYMQSEKVYFDANYNNTPTHNENLYKGTSAAPFRNHRNATDVQHEKLTLWATENGVYGGGIWLQKKDKIPGFDSTTAATERSGANNYSIYKNNEYCILHAPEDPTDYFFLPAFGQLFTTSFTSLSAINISTNGFTTNCYYWSAAVNPNNSSQAIAIYSMLSMGNIIVPKTASYYPKSNGHVAGHRPDGSNWFQ